MDSNQQIILRRFIRSAESGESEPIRLETLKQVGSAELDNGTDVCQVQARVEKNFCFYLLNLSNQSRVIPVDWRRFSYDHKKVSELLSNCINDNVSQYSFGPFSKEVLGRIEKTLIIALYDLKSIFEVKSVNCEIDFDLNIVTTVVGEHMNGEQVSYIVNVNTYEDL